MSSSDWWRWKATSRFAGKNWFKLRLPLVRALAVEGADVAVCARKEWAARKLASEAKENSGVKAAGYGIDARSTDDLVSRIMADFGSIDILFGIARRPKLSDRNALSPGCWQIQFDKGFLRFKAVTEALLPGMRNQRWGRVLWMTPWSNPGTTAERQLDLIMKAELSAWLATVADDVAGSNVTANLLIPMPMSRTIDTMGATPLSGGDRILPASTPIRAGDSPSLHHVALVVTFLLSNPASGFCGMTIEINI